MFIIWAVDGWFPSSKAVEDPDELEEERRLMYVALTRAKDELAVIYPMQVYGSRRSAGRYSFDPALPAFSTAAFVRRCSAWSSKKKGTHRPPSR